MELTKFSEGNLMVLQNFILFLTHCEQGDVEASVKLSYTADELYKIAEEYIEEDHVDGENSEEAQLEREQSKEEETWFEVFTIDEEEGTETVESFDKEEEAVDFIDKNKSNYTRLSYDKWTYKNGENLQIDI